jgi:hypothetical protein
VCGIDLSTKKVMNYSNAPDQYDEPEGIFPDGRFTLVECDRQNRKGSGYVDLWKLKLDGSGHRAADFLQRLFGYKASTASSRRWTLSGVSDGEVEGPGGRRHGIFVRFEEGGA